jgi:hypothetical protein
VGLLSPNTRFFFPSPDSNTSVAADVEVERVAIEVDVVEVEAAAVEVAMEAEGVMAALGAGDDVTVIPGGLVPTGGAMACL